MSNKPVIFHDASVRANEVVANQKLAIGTSGETSELHIKAAAPEFRMEDKVGAAASETAFKIYADGGKTYIQSGVNFEAGSASNIIFGNMGSTESDCFLNIGSHGIETSGNIAVNNIQFQQLQGLEQITNISNTTSNTLNTTNTTAATSTGTGAITCAGGVGVAGNVYSGGLVLTTSTEPSVSPTTGAIQVAGGVGVAGNVYVGGTVGSSATGALTIPAGTTAQQPGTSYEGMIRYNSTTRSVEFYNGSVWITLNSFSASGGTESTSGDYKIHTFQADGDFTVYGSGTVDVLLVAGGGSGSAGRHDLNVPGGGGGAGGVIVATNVNINAGVYSIVVGVGGSAVSWITSTGAEGNPGSDTTFHTYTAIGGGRGRLNNTTSDGDGGSGGGSGGGGVNTAGAKDGGSGTDGQGYDGGNAHPYTTNGGSANAGGGGGGGSGVGGDASASTGGNGAHGLINGFSGTNTRYGAGGGGAGATAGSGGNGGGGAGSTGATNGGNGSEYTGSGGGGNRGNGGGSSGKGGKGIVIIRYLA